MQVVLKSNFDAAGLFSRGSIDVQEGIDMRALLELLSRQCRLHFIDPGSGEVNAVDFTITLNGNEHPFWPQGLSTLLCGGDEVCVLVIPLGGG
jgi:hypothetical protein